MTTDEELITTALINAGKAASYEEIYERASRATGVPLKDVKEIAERLSRELILWMRGGPAHNLAEGIPVGPPAEAWFEKGSTWPKKP
jgi:hypothetical protein